MPVPKRRHNNTTDSGEASDPMPRPGTPSMLNGGPLEPYPEFEKRLTPSVDDYNGAIPKGQKPAHRRKKAVPKEETTAPPKKVGRKKLGIIAIITKSAPISEQWASALVLLVGIILSGLVLQFASTMINVFSKFVEPIEKQEPQPYDRTDVPQKLFKKDDQKLDWQLHLITVQLKLRQGTSEIKIMSDDDIKYKDGGKLYVVLAGFVFDVSAAPQMYGKGEGYHGFVGRDGSRAFVTGKFTDEGLIPTLMGLTPDENKAISNWINFYLNHETYKFVGLHKGWYFDEKGEKTWRMTELEEALVKAETLEKAQTETDKLFPGCNMEWNVNQGSKLSCSKQSGGVSRQWVGFPRSFKVPEDGNPPRCVCVHPNHLTDPRVSMYKGCDPKSVVCKLPDDNNIDDE